MPNEEFLGTGMKFPPQINPATGRFMSVSGEQSVKESIYLILMTHRGERLLRQSFGTDLLSYAFMETDEVNLNLVRRDLTRQILRQEPRISAVDIDISTEREGVLLFQISYEVRNSNVTGNLVFPFYLDTAVEAEEKKQQEPDVYDADEVYGELTEESDVW